MLLSEDHRMIRDAVRDFVAAELAPGAARRDREASVLAAVASKVSGRGVTESDQERPRRDRE